MKRVEIFLLLVILAAAALMRIPLIAQGFFAFTYDQGRDLIAVKEIVVNHNFTLIGPTTGLPGVFYGPWWYYFLSPVFLATGGDPLAMTLFFGVLGTLTVGFIYWLIFKLTKNQFVSLATCAIAVFSQPFLVSSSQIWNPSLVLPLMGLYMLSLYQTLKNPKPLWFVILGLVSGFILDTQAAFGVMLFAATVIAGLALRKKLLLKNYVYFFLGFLLVLTPRIIFDLRNDFLITNSVISWLTIPSVYQQKLTIGERIINRLDLFYLNFAQTFAQSHKIKAALPAVLSVFWLISLRSKLRKDRLMKFLLLLLLLIYLGFTIYPDAVWDYYLIGLPIIFLTVFAILAKYAYFRWPFLTRVFLIASVFVNFSFNLFSPFTISWPGDGAIYRNMVGVIDDLKPQLHGAYSLYVYSPAGFDYPFAYILDRYNTHNQIDLPKDGQERFYLIIRDDASHSYLSSGWYGDKTKDTSTLVERHEATGNFIVEKHLRND